MTDPLTINLSLVSHTNAGKTTLARTLLGQDIGEVSDRAHVTLDIEDYVLARTPTGAVLTLWDTPGFGNSERLAARLEGRSNPIGWFVSEVWDRWTGRTLFYNQKLVRHIRDTTSVVLYLVNAAEAHEAGTYLPSEMKILGWIGKPVIVLLNQLGAPRERRLEDAELESWKSVLAPYALVRCVLPLDAFARCWVQEGALFEAIGDVIDPEQRSAYEDLRRTWKRRKNALYSSSMQAIGFHLSRLVRDAETVPAVDIMDRLRQLGSRLGFKQKIPGPIVDAQSALAARATDSLCQLTQKLLEINELRGQGLRREILTRLRSSDTTVSSGIDLKEGALAGAIASGAASGLAADLMSGGLTLGLGALIGSLIGALGGAGAAYAYNSMAGRSDGEGLVHWSAEALFNFTAEAVLLYLAVAHFGRGRGNWVQGESPACWRESVKEALGAVKLDAEMLRARSVDGTQADLTRIADRVTRAVLEKLYGRSEA